MLLGSVCKPCGHGQSLGVLTTLQRRRGKKPLSGRPANESKMTNTPNHRMSPWLLSYLAVQTVHLRSSALTGYMTREHTSAPLWKKWPAGTDGLVCLAA